MQNPTQNFLFLIKYDRQKKFHKQIFNIEDEDIKKELSNLFNTVNHWSKCSNSPLDKDFPLVAGKFAFKKVEFELKNDDKLNNKKNALFNFFKWYFEFAFYEIVYDWFCEYKKTTKAINFTLEYYKKQSQTTDPYKFLEQKIEERYEFYSKIASAHLISNTKNGCKNHPNVIEPDKCVQHIKTNAEKNLMRFVTLASAVCHWRKRAIEIFVKSYGTIILYAGNFINYANLCIKEGSCKTEKKFLFIVDNKRRSVSQELPIGKQMTVVTKGQRHKILTYYVFNHSNKSV